MTSGVTTGEGTATPFDIVASSASALIQIASFTRRSFECEWMLSPLSAYALLHSFRCRSPHWSTVAQNWPEAEDYDFGFRQVALYPIVEPWRYV